MHFMRKSLNTRLKVQKVQKVAAQVHYSEIMIPSLENRYQVHTTLLLLEWCNYLQSNGQQTSGKKAHSIRTVAIARVVLLLCREMAAV